MYTELIDPDLPGYVEARAPAGTLPGIFTDAWQEAAQQAGTVPVLTCDADTAIALGAGVGAALTIKGALYAIRERQPRNGGGVSLILEQQ
ncbi:hypothetical protein ACL7TT_19530 [Microbulbifer sp. 2304DJ12-6]|uniref:hypothetical protein n=1 Tax=Microbulbifer sp. 2304DJ12-6 TaxID=3233340 RepID=UPI0039B053E2